MTRVLDNMNNDGKIAMLGIPGKKMVIGVISFSKV
jgi:hypothetical protein